VRYNAQIRGLMTYNSWFNSQQGQEIFLCSKS